IPNLERERYEIWRSKLTRDCREAIDAKFANVTFIFKEDPSVGSHDFYFTLKHFLSETGNRVSMQIYENFAPLLAGLSSATVLKSLITLDSSKISENAAISILSDSIERQDPKSSSASSVISKNQKLDSQTSIVELSKVVILSPGQKSALDGPRRQ